MGAEILSCSDCHSEQPDLAEKATGLVTATEFRREMSDLTSQTARAERLLLASHRGGVQTSGAADEIDQAVEAQIELAVLVHSFDRSPEGKFAAAAARGLEHADAALDRADKALADLRFRRRGLAASLGVIALFLVALALKIRQMSG